MFGITNILFTDSKSHSQLRSNATGADNKKDGKSYKSGGGGSVLARTPILVAMQGESLHKVVHNGIHSWWRIQGLYHLVHTTQIFFMIHTFLPSLCVLSM